MFSHAFDQIAIRLTSIRPLNTISFPAVRISNVLNRFRIQTYNDRVGKITETEFDRICRGLAEDRDVIIKHNPIGSPAETLLWMLVSCLVSYLSLEEIETPCFTGRPDEAAYRDAIRSIVERKGMPSFDVAPHLDALVNNAN